MLRYVRWGEREVLRGIYGAVRDHNWGTLQPTLSQLQLSTGPERFAVAFQADCRDQTIDFGWKGIIEGSSDGTLRFSFDGTARTNFLRNRIGLCVLYPAECAGVACQVEHTDGTVQEGHLPQDISPHQPFFRIRSIRHPLDARVWAKVVMDGEVFEMEDQRNWTDASFKVYSTPLELPFPVQVQAKDTVSQSVQLELIGGRTPASSDVAKGVPWPIQPAEQWRALPPIGLAVNEDQLQLSPREQQQLAALHLSHLRVPLRLFDADWKRLLEAADQQAQLLGTSLDLAVTVDDAGADQLDALRAQMQAVRSPLGRMYLFHVAAKSTPARWIDVARESLAGSRQRIALGGGTDAFFAELNRGRPDVTGWDAVCFSVNPQVHATDDLSIVETLQAQPQTVHTARRFCGPVPIDVGPVTLRPRFNPNATGPEPPVPPGELPSTVDVRQSGPFTAAWTLGSVVELAWAGAARLTYYETVGWRGVLESDQGPPLPDRFWSVPGGVYCVYHVLYELGRFAGGQLARLPSPDPLALVGAALRCNDRISLLMANVSPKAQTVVLPDPGRWGGQHFQLRTLDETTCQLAMRDPEVFQQRSDRCRSGRVPLAAHALLFADVD